MLPAMMEMHALKPILVSLEYDSIYHIICSILDQCHNAGVCDPSNGICDNPEKDNTTSCDDGNGCTQTDLCYNGICTGTNPIICTASDQCHNAGSCNPSSGI